MGGLPFFRGLSFSDLRFVSSRFRQVRCAPGEVIYLCRSTAERFFVVAEGTVKLLRPTPAGRDVLIDFLDRGQFFGNLTGRAESLYPDTAIAQTACCLLAVSAAGLRSILGSYPSVALSMLGIAAEQLDLAYDTIRRLSAHPVEQRIAYILRKLAGKLGEQGEEGVVIHLPLSRSDLAQMAGTTPETVTKFMQRLKERAIVRSGRKWVSIKNEAALTEISEGRSTAFSH